MTPSCRVCGRPLRSERWAALRIGPVCERRTRGHTAPRAVVAHATPDIHPGQTEIPLPPMQHELELTWRTR